MIEASVPNRLTGNELIESMGASTQLIEFWQWAFSDVLSNSLRGIYAEFLVAKALGVTTGTRLEWASFDLTTADSKKRVEVKSSAYLQTWAQQELSKVIFSVSPSIGYNYETGLYDETPKRQSDLYVFCLLTHQDMSTVEPLNLDQWLFYVLPTRVLNENLQNQKTISLSRLLVLNPKQVRFEGLSEAIEECSI